MSLLTVLGGPGRRGVVLMNQSSWDHTLQGVRPSPGPGRGAVSPQSSRDKRAKRSLPGSTVRREGSAISGLLYLVPAVTAVLAVPVLGQPVDAEILAGLAVTFAGVVLVNRDARPVPAPAGRLPVAVAPRG